MQTLFNAVASTLFMLVSLLHIFRIVLGWEVEVGMTEIPFWLSWSGMFGGAALSLWGFSLIGKKDK